MPPQGPRRELCTATSTCRQRYLPILGVGLLMLGLVGGASAEPFELPGDLELGPGPISIELDNATLDIIHQSGTATLRARPRSSDDEAIAVLEVTHAGAIRVRRPEKDPGTRHLLLELTVDPEVPLEVQGVELDLVIEGERGARRRRAFRG